MRCQRLPADITSVTRDLLIGALVAAALIAGPMQTAEKHLLAGVPGLQSKTAVSPSKPCSAQCAPAAPNR
jgi:hypothetical protein